MSVDIIEQLVVDLSSTLEVPLLDSLRACLDDLTVDTDISYASSLLLTSSAPQSLLTTLIMEENRDKNRMITNARVRGLKLVADWIKTKGANSVDTLAIAVIQQSLALYKTDESNEIKAAALMLVRNVLRLRIKNILSEEALRDLDIAAIVPSLLECLRFGKHSKGSKAELFKVLGHLVACFPLSSTVIESIPILTRICTLMLQENFNLHAGAEPDLPAIGGAFSCLDRCLTVFPNCLNASEFSALLRHILTVLASVYQQDLKRYAIISKALVGNYSSGELLMLKFLSFKYIEVASAPWSFFPA